MVFSLRWTQCFTTHISPHLDNVGYIWLWNLFTHCNSVNIMLLARLQLCFMWFFKSNEIFCAPLPNGPVIRRALDMVDWCTFTNHWPLCSFPHRSPCSSLEGQSFCGNVWMLWFSPHLLIIVGHPDTWIMFCAHFLIQTFVLL